MRLCDTATRLFQLAEGGQDFPQYLALRPLLWLATARPAPRQTGHRQCGPAAQPKLVSQQVDEADPCGQVWPGKPV